MFEDLTVPISEQMIETSNSIMHISRYLGCFPIIVYKYKTTLYLKWSPKHALYSVVFGIIIITSTYHGYITDVLIGKDKSIRNKSQTDVFVTFFDVFVVSSAAFCGIFVTPFKFGTLCKYIECLNKVDSKIPSTITNYSRYLPTFVTYLMLLLLLILQIIDTIMYYITRNSNGSDVFYIIRCYTPFYICYQLMLLNVCLFWHLTYCILKRIKVLNNCLNVEYFLNLQVKDMNISVAPIRRRGTSRFFEIASMVRKMTDKKSVYKLMLVYERLCDAAEFLNTLLGINCAVMIMGSLFHLIITFYALIMEILGPRDDPLFIFMMIAWTAIHMARLLFIAEPSYACLIQVQKTKDLVSNLLSSTEINSYYKSQLRDFALILQLRSFNFTAYGLATIDRTLITSILAAITTYLVIILQFTQATH